LESYYKKYPEIIVLSDEVYEYITFEEKHISAHTHQSKPLRNGFLRLENHFMSPAGK
jgi:methionine aminotransferase